MGFMDETSGDYDGTHELDHDRDDDKHHRHLALANLDSQDNKHHRHLALANLDSKCNKGKSHHSKLAKLSSKGNKHHRHHRHLTLAKLGNKNHSHHQQLTEPQYRHLALDKVISKSSHNMVAMRQQFSKAMDRGCRQQALAKLSTKHLIFTNLGNKGHSHQKAMGQSATSRGRASSQHWQLQLTRSHPWIHQLHQPQLMRRADCILAKCTVVLFITNQKLGCMFGGRQKGAILTVLS